MVQDLDQHSIGIFKIEGARTVPVRLDGLGQSNPTGLHPTGNEINVFRSWDNKSYMMDSLNWPGKLTIGKLVYRQVIASRGQINIVRIRLPFNPKSKDINVKVCRFTNILNIEGDVPKT